MKTKLAWIVLVAILLLQTHPARALTTWRAHIDPRVWQDLATTGTAPVLVRLANLPAMSPQMNSSARNLQPLDIDLRIQQAENSQRGIKATLGAQGLAYRSYWIVNVIALGATPALLNQLAARQDVIAIESDRPFRPSLEAPEPGSSIIAAPGSPETGLLQVHAPDLWALGIRGQGIVVASADTGVRWDHQSLKSKYRGWNGSLADHNYNWWDAIHGTGVNSPCGYDSQAPCDDHGHGTHTVGTMVGDDDLGNQIGMAPGATWIACRNMDHGIGQPSTYIECLQFFFAPTNLAGKDPDPARRPDVIDNSYACPPGEGCSSTSLHEAITQVRAAGILMSVAAGNSGPNCATIVDPPAVEPGVFTVGSVDSAGIMASTSSRGPAVYNNTQFLKPSLVAPGVSVRSSYYSSTSSYTTMSGTSMAAPHVAGAVALLWSAFPGLRHDILSTELLLRATAAPKPVSQACGDTPAGAVPNNTSGYGLLDALAAYNRWLSQPSIGYRSYLTFVANP